MKLLNKKIEKEGNGFVSLVPENSEDMWHLYHIIMRGDRVKGSTFRKITKETNTGSTSSTRLRMVLAISADNIHFDPTNGIILFLFYFFLLLLFSFSWTKLEKI